MEDNIVLPWNGDVLAAEAGDFGTGPAKSLLLKIAGGGLPTGENKIGTVNQAYKTVIPYRTTISSSGDNIIVAGSGSLRYRQVLWFVQNTSSTTTTVIVKIGATVLGAAALPGNWSLTIAPPESAWPLGAAGDSMVVNLSGANAHTVTAWYIKEAA